MKLTITLDLDVDLAEYDYRFGGNLRATGRDPVDVIRDRVVSGMERALDNEADPTRPRQQPIIVERIELTERDPT